MRRVGLIVAVITLFVVSISVSVMISVYRRADADNMQLELIKVSLLLKNEQAALGRAVRDFAIWDDAYQYIKSPNRKFEKDNFTGFTLDVMQVHFAAMLTAPDKVIFATELQPGFRKDEMPPVKSHDILPTLAQLPEWRNPMDEGTPHVYLTLINQRPALLAVSGITDSAMTFPHNGLMVMGRFLDGNTLSELQDLAGIRIALTAAAPTPIRTGNLMHVQVAASQTLDAWGKPPLWLQVSKEINWSSRYTMMGTFVLVLVVILMLAAWVLQHSLHRLVVERVETFAYLAWRRTQGDRVYWPVSGTSELDLLARSFNELMDEVQSAQQNLRDLSITDALTALGNRRGMEEQVDKLMQNSPSPMALTMLLLDLDGFKLINDSLGHAAGDLLLQEVAQRMRQLMRWQDKLFRMGGDEFAVLMPNTNIEQGRLMAERLVGLLLEPIHFGHHTLSISGSVGVAEWDRKTDGLELMRHADLAMYAAKREGKSCVRVYEKGMSGVASERMTLEQALRRAITEQTIEPYFQPVIDTDNDQVVAVEMLARWQHENEFVPALGFIRLAEDLGLISQLSAQLLGKGLSALCEFRRKSPALKLQINLSPLQFADRHLAVTILRAVQEHGLPSSALAVELTEGAMLLYPDQVEQTMRQFVAAGVSLHLDDFGTGYSSLARLRDLPFDTVKLDRSFVMLLTDGDTALSRAVFDMATSMQMELIAEGVENQTEYNELHQIGYRQMQGFMFARPMPASALLQWLDTPHERSGVSELPAEPEANV